MSWAKGMFEKPKRSRPGRDGATKSDAPGGAPGVRTRKQDTLIELRWHLPLPHDGASAQATSAALCRAELSATAPPPRIPTLSQEELAEGRQQTNAAASVRHTPPLPPLPCPKAHDRVLGLRLAGGCTVVCGVTPEPGDAATAERRCHTHTTPSFWYSERREREAGGGRRDVCRR